MSRRTLLALLATVVLLAPLGWFWYSSLLPRSFSVMDMGYRDYGGGPVPPDVPGTATAMSGMVGQPMPGHQPAAPGRSAATLTGPDRPPDVRYTLVARRQPFRLGDGRTVDGYTVNGTSPGPTLHAVLGQLIEIRLVNESVPDGVTLHWHGVDVPGAEDGVAGVTQDAVPTGGSFTYRFVAADAGTYWYHSHQVSHVQVERGLLGALVITPPGQGLGEVALVHRYDGVSTVNGRPGELRWGGAPGSTHRVRVINTDNGPTRVWVAGTGYRLLAIDGRDVHEPTPVTDAAVLLTAGARADLEITLPADGAPARLGVGGSAVVLGDAPWTAPIPAAPQPTLDPLHYGGPAALGFDPGAATRRFEYAIGRRPGFVDGVPGFYWTINGHQFPDVPMFVVAEGDVVRMHLSNASGQPHPMHLHGHHAVVLSRNGIPSTGSPWWIDSLNVADGESYDIAFVADNPGIWMDHCHNLPHAQEGLIAHLMYAGITEPYAVGGGHHNQPE